MPCSSRTDDVFDASPAEAFLPLRDLCNLKTLSVSNARGLSLIRDGLDQLSHALGITGQECHHSAPQLLPASVTTQCPAQEPDIDDADDSFELRYVRSWLTRLISELTMSFGTSSDEDQEEQVETLFDRVSELLSACAGKMASGPTTKIHTFDRGDLDVRLPLRDGTLIHDSLGTHTWGAAPILTQLLLPLYPQPSGPIKVLELGAGTGLVGLAAARWLASSDPDREHIFVSTDYHPTVLENLAHNALINAWDEDDKSGDSRTRFEVRTLDWQAVDAEQSRTSSGEAYVSTAQTVSSLPTVASQAKWAGGPEDVEGVGPRMFDLLIAADCIYDPEHPRWIRSVANKYLRRPSSVEGTQCPLLHLMLPLRPTHTQELKAIYEAFPSDSATDATEMGLRILDESDYVGYDNFGAPSLMPNAKRARSANQSVYKWIQIGWSSAIG